MRPLRRGDDRPLTVSELVDVNGNATTFLAGDTLTFTVKRNPSDFLRDAVLVASTAAGTIAFTPGTGTASISVSAAAWGDPSTHPFRYAEDCAYDLELVRAGQTTTLAAGTVTVLPDVTNVTA